MDVWVPTHAMKISPLQTMCVPLLPHMPTTCRNGHTLPRLWRKWVLATLPFLPTQKTVPPTSYLPCTGVLRHLTTQVFPQQLTRQQLITIRDRLASSFHRIIQYKLDRLPQSTRTHTQRFIITHKTHQNHPICCGREMDSEMPCLAPEKESEIWDASPTNPSNPSTILMQGRRLTPRPTHIDNTIAWDHWETNQPNENVYYTIQTNHKTIHQTTTRTDKTTTPRHSYIFYS